MKSTLLYIKVSGLLLLIVLLPFIIMRFINPNLKNISVVKKYIQSNKHFTPSESSVWGIDISHHQGNVNWTKMDDLKPKFVFIKVTEGSSHIDRKYKKYKKELRSQSILTGAYHFFSYYSSGKAQALHFIKHANLKRGDLPPVLDAENQGNMPNKSKISKELLAFIETIEKELNVKPIIYCTENYYKKYLKAELSSNYVLWICDFNREPKSDYAFWQKTDQLYHPSFIGRVDYNVFNGSYEELYGLRMR